MVIPTGAGAQQPRNETRRQKDLLLAHVGAAQDADAGCMIVRNG